MAVPAPRDSITCSCSASCPRAPATKSAVDNPVSDLIFSFIVLPPALPAIHQKGRGSEPARAADLRCLLFRAFLELRFHGLHGNFAPKADDPRKCLRPAGRNRRRDIPAPPSPRPPAGQPPSPHLSDRPRNEPDPAATLPRNDRGRPERATGCEDPIRAFHAA